jgi:hypothetical protein
MAFCAKLNEMGAAPAGWRFTLPTESQWEYAARGGKKDRQCKFSGSDELEEVGWYGDSKPEEGAREHQGTTHRVALKKANELGLYDMSGNVWEWTLDDYVGDSSQLKNPELRHVISGSAEVTKKCPTCAHASTVREEVGCQFRTVRGGSWSKGERHCRNAQRYYYNAAYATNYIGFRVVLVKATPTEIAQMAIDALKKQDIDAVIALAHGKAQEELKAHAKKFAELKKAAADGDEEKKATLAKIQGMLDKISLTVKGGEIDGDRAVVDIERKLDGEIGADKIYLKKIDGVWKLVDESEFSAAK